MDDRGLLEPITAVKGREAGCTLDISPETQYGFFFILSCILFYFKFQTFKALSKIIPFLILFCLAHFAIIPVYRLFLFCLYFLPLSLSFSSYPLAAWVGAMQVVRAKDTRVEGLEVGDLGFGPSGKDNKSCSCPIPAFTHRLIPPEYLLLPTDSSPQILSLSPKICLWLIFSFHSHFAA